MSRPLRLTTGPLVWSLAMARYDGDAFGAMQLLTRYGAPARARIWIVARHWQGEDLARGLLQVRSAQALLDACRQFGWIEGDRIVAPGPPEVSIALGRKIFGPQYTGE